MALNPKQQRFVAEYLVDLNATQAAIRAGYSAKTAEQQGPRLLGNVEIATAVAAGKSRQLETADLSAARVLEELRRLAFSNVLDLFDEHGNLRPIHTLTREQAACIASLEVIKKNAEAGDGKIDTVHKVKVWDKTRVLEMCAKHFALLTDVVKLTDDATNIQRLIEGRKRAAAARAARQ
jgi:phage terminase small subunit